MENNAPPVVPQPQSIENVVPPQQPPVPSQQSNKRRLIIVALIVIVVLILILSGLFIVVNNKNIQSSITPTQKVTLTPTKIIPTITLSPAIELTLEKGKQIQIPDSDVEILYLGAEIPNPNCIDCSTTTDIVLLQKGVEKKLQYLCGGIAGECTNKLSGFGYQVELVEANENLAKVKITKI